MSETGLAVAADRTAAYVTRCRVDGRKVIGLRDVRSDQGQHTDNRRLADARL